VYLRFQYDYLHYSQQRTNYWTPPSWRVASPILSVSLPVCKGFHIDGDASLPYVLNLDRPGYVIQGGPVLDLGTHVQFKASAIEAHIPGVQVTWSGWGWQAYLQVRF